MKKMFAFFLILILINGCVQQTGDGVSLKLQADPPYVFGGSTTTLHVDIENKDTKTLENIVVDVFDTGILNQLQICDWDGCDVGPCKKSEFGRYGNKFMPQQFETFSCILQAPKIEQTLLTTDVNVRASFMTNFSAIQIIEIMTEKEYKNRIASSNFKQLPKSYSYRDKYIQLDIEFSEPLPIVVREGKKYFIYFKFRNVGNGFINPIYPEDLYLEQMGNIIECNGKSEEKINLLDRPLEPIGKSFPRIGCEIHMPSDVEYLANYQIILYLKYKYEIRDGITINIIR